MARLFWLGAPLAGALLALTLLLAWMFPPAAWVCGSLALLVTVLLLAYLFGWNGATLLLEPIPGAGRELDSPTPFEAGTPPQTPPEDQAY